MITKVNAKVNVGLYVTDRREDGYHNLQTLFLPVGLYNGTPVCPYPFLDILEIVPASGGDHTFSFTGNNIDCPLEKNLVVKALHSFEKAFQEQTGDPLPKYDIYLEKHLPDGAGMGGGSADASFTLRLLNEMNGNPFGRDRLIEIAAGIGADCPFFIINRPCLASGIGDRLEEVELDLEGKWMLVLKPGHSVSTREAFSGITPCRPETDVTFPLKNDISEWRGRVANHFEKSLFPLYPDMELLKDLHYSEGAEFALMSGSGSAVFGIYSSRQDAEKAMCHATDGSDIYHALIKL